MKASTATVDTPLRQIWPWFPHGQVGRFALRGLNILLQVGFGPSGLRVPRHRQLTVSPTSTSMALIILRVVDLGWHLGGFVTNHHE